MGWKIKFRHQIRIFKYSIILAIRSMRHRSFRTFLTVIGIMIGITTFTALMSIGIGLRMQIYQILNQFVGASMIVMSKISSTRPNIPYTVGDYLEQIDGINKTYGLIEDFATVGGKNIMLTGIEPEEMDLLLGLKTIEGESLKDAVARGVPYACVIDESLKKQLILNVNDTFIATSGITGTFIELKVVGIVETLDITSGIGLPMGGLCYTELKTMQEFLLTTNVLVFLIGLEEGSDTDEV
ncbi:MAG: ABC transporter permease, partial [Promethearchaeota archaeon]